MKIILNIMVGISLILNVSNAIAADDLQNPLKLTRVYADKEGVSHFQTVPLDTVMIEWIKY